VVNRLLKEILRILDKEELRIIIPIISLLATIIARFIIFPIRVQSHSMFPSLQPGDLKLVYKQLNGNYERRDVLVFYAKEYGKNFTKRLKALFMKLYINS